ncbi:MAG: rRNA maturation RNase YbeY [Lentisphaeria bacterium]|nr:rRNA maturation RNase YbeY [Lentisphaeria bacterium]MBQ7396207.1 rRNA maturation RNase YbeY [Lentisphaeria bacterium]MBR7118631.1 rRNA maturation RNase YbeY [Lentisphaeria bacterium]
MKKIQYKWKNRNHPAPQRSKLNSFAVRAAHHAGLPESFDWFCSVEFVNDNIMTRRNRELLGHEGTTDVITFSYFDEEFPEMLEGETAIELIVNPDAAMREGAKRKNSSYSRETALYVVHGLLHSAGEDDLDPVSRRRMRLRERAVMSALEKEGFIWNELFPEG